MTPKLERLLLFQSFGSTFLEIFHSMDSDTSGLSGYDLTHHHDQAVDKNNTEGHIPQTNVNYINLCLLCYD